MMQLGSSEAACHQREEHCHNDSEHNSEPQRREEVTLTCNRTEDECKATSRGEVIGPERSCLQGSVGLAGCGAVEPRMAGMFRRVQGRLSAQLSCPGTSSKGLELGKSSPQVILQEA